MLDYQTNPDGKSQRFSTAHTTGAVVLACLLLLIIIRHGLRGLI